MATSREYQLTMEAILHAINALDPTISAKAHKLWQQGGCQALGAWADITPMTTALDLHDTEMLETLRDLCVALNTLIEEDCK